MFVIKAKDTEDFRKQVVEFISEQAATEMRRVPQQLTKFDKAFYNGRAIALEQIAYFIKNLQIEEEK